MEGKPNSQVLNLYHVQMWSNVQTWCKCCLLWERQRLKLHWLKKEQNAVDNDLIKNIIIQEDSSLSGFQKEWSTVAVPSTHNRNHR